MSTAPEGYIDVRSAIDAYVKLVLGGWKPDRWVKVKLKKSDARPLGVKAGKIVERLDGSAGREQDQVATTWLREEFAAGRLTAVIESPTGRRALPVKFWETGPWRGAVHTGYVDGWEGASGYAVFVEHDAFEARLTEVTGSQSGKRGPGRPPNAGAYKDAPALAQMKKLLESGEAKSIADAARMTLHLVNRGASEKSGVDRLCRKFRIETREKSDRK